MYMNKIVEVILIGSLVFVLLANPSSLSSFADSIAGRALLICLIVMASLHNTISGLIAVLIFVSIRNNTIEGHRNHSGEDDADEGEEVSNTELDKNVENDKSPSSDEIEFRVKNCKKGSLVDKDGNKVSDEDIGVLYPNLNLDSDKCNNPCDDNCGFSISTTADQIGIEENLRALDSSKIPVNPNQSSEDAQPTQISSTKGNTVEGFFSY